MSERVNIAAVAEVVSEDIFNEFGWKAVGPPNESWVCNVPELHEHRDHPTDVTFSYEDPYSSRNIHLLTDLKSYAASSIKPFSLRETIESLAMAVDCAKSNPNWKRLYLQPGAAFEIQGLLFVYNHDAEYDKDFADELNTVFQSEVKIPKGVRISVLGPDDIWYMSEMLSDIAILSRKWKMANSGSELSFYYHSDSRKRFVRRTENTVASIDMLKGRYQIISYTKPSDDGGLPTRGILLYYKGLGETEREFVLLIDMLRHYGLLDSYSEIHIRSARGCDHASVSFEKARTQYAAYQGDATPPKLKKITFSSISAVRPRVTNFEVALRT